VPQERVLVRRVTDLALAVQEVLDFLAFDFAGRRVWLKPNLLGPFAPEDGVTTDPELVRQVVRQLKQRGAKEVWVADSPSGNVSGQLRAVLARTGVVDASEGHFHDQSAEPVAMPVKSRFVSEVSVFSIIGQADVILSLPVFKTHGLTLLTGAIKNMYGVVIGGQKSRFHALAQSADEFAELVVDIYQAIPVPMLHIMDALRGMDGQMGPSAGRVLKLGTLLAARNGVALDAVMTLMAGWNPERIPTTRIAGERGLGPVEHDDIEITGDFAPIPGFRMPSAMAATSVGRFIRFGYSLYLRRPVLVPERCTRCNLCIENCPVQAITMQARGPRIDRRTCVLCYCCLECCSEHAWRISQGLEAVGRNLLRR
jgi:uncharacterized protein (DUF362 family)/NAD-dependent dihydropyrimidine dehydrogenase PreA subunit